MTIHFTFLIGFSSNKEVFLTQLYQTFVCTKLSLGQIWGDTVLWIATLSEHFYSKVCCWQPSKSLVHQYGLQHKQRLSNTLTPFKSKPRRYYFHRIDNAKLPYKVKGMILYIWECVSKREMYWVKRTYLLNILQILSPVHLESSFITAPLSVLHSSIP